MSHEANPIVFLLAVAPIVLLILAVWLGTRMRKSQNPDQKAGQMALLGLVLILLLGSLMCLPMVFGALTFPG